MNCDCGRPQSTSRHNFPATVIEINNPERLILFRKVVIPASIGDETMLPPTIGLYKNVLLEYGVNNHLYLYSSDGIPTQLSSDVASLVERVESLSSSLSHEIDDREAADTELQQSINALQAAMPITFTTTEWNNFWN